METLHRELLQAINSWVDDESYQQDRDQAAEKCYGICMKFTSEFALWFYESKIKRYSNGWWQDEKYEIVSDEGLVKLFMKTKEK